MIVPSNKKTIIIFTLQKLEIMKRIGLFLLALTLLVVAQAAEKVNMDSLKNAIITQSKEIQEQKKDSMMLSKLSPNQLLEIKNKELDNQRRQIEKDGCTEMPLPSFYI